MTRSRGIPALLASLLLTAAAAALPLRFQVRMSYQIELGHFDPGQDFCDLAGTFNGWGTDPLTPLADGDGDAIYEVTLDGFAPGEEIEFKFRINGQWDGSEEFPGGGPNREYTVREEGNEILVWYGDVVPDHGPPVAGFDAHPRRLRAGEAAAFEDLSAGALTWWRWSFEGGEPAASTEPEPVVAYAAPGLYDVTLAVGDGEAADTLHAEDFIEVEALDLGELSWWNDAVFYEIFLRSFFDSDADGVGDLPGLTARLDYLNDGDPGTQGDLGVDALWLMPVSDSPSYHGYDVTDYRSINPDYGDMDDFAVFLDAAHARGLRVIVDFVMNHSSDEHPWFQAAAAQHPEYRDWYTWSSYDPGQTGPWGQQVWHWHPTGWYYGLFTADMPDLNYETAAVQDSMFDTARFWLEEVGVDGFRLDAVLYIHEDGDQLQNTPATMQFWQDWNQHVKAVAPEALSVGEAWTNTQTVLDYVSEERLDLCFEFDLSYATVGAAAGGDAGWLAWKAREVYSLYPFLQYATFLTNHDQDRVFEVLGRDEAKARTAAGLLLTMPGVPFLYYGEEIGMAGAGPHEAVRRPMQWTDGPHAGFSTAEPWTELNDNYEDFNVLVEQDDPGSLLSWYRRLIALRHARPALRRGSYLPLDGSAPPVLAFLRRHEDETLMVLGNTAGYPLTDLSLSAAGAGLPPGDYALADLLHEGDTLEITVDAELRIEGLDLEPHELGVYALSGPSGGDPGDGAPPYGLGLGPVFPNPFNPATTIRYTLPERGAVRLRVFDVTGRRRAVLRDGVQEAGPHELRWDGADGRGRPMGAGVYLLRLDAAGRSRSTKMVLLK